MKQFSLTLLLLAVISFSYGQAKVGAFGEIIVDEAAPVPSIMFSSKNPNNKKAKSEANINKQSQLVQLEQPERTGQTIFKIQVLVADSPLDLSHHIFTSYDKVSFSQAKGIGYTYYSGEYKDKILANKMLEKVQRVYPKASLVEEQIYLPIPGK